MLSQKAHTANKRQNQDASANNPKPNATVVTTTLRHSETIIYTTRIHKSGDKTPKFCYMYYRIIPISHMKKLRFTDVRQLAS